MKDTVTFDRITVAADQFALFSSIEPIVAAKTDGSALRARPTPFKAQRRLAQGGMATVSVLALAACQGGGSGGSGSSANGTSGVVVKGPVEGAFVFSDNNDNGVFDEGEAYGITGSDGSFLLADGDIDPGAPIIANLEGAVDTTSGRVYGEGETFTAPAGSTVISAYTTMMQEEGWSADALGTLLGLEAGEFDPTTFNPYADGTDPTLALVAEGRAQQIMAIVDTLTAVLEAAGLEGETAYDLVQEVVAGRLDDDFDSIGAMIYQVIDDLLAKEVVQEAEGGVTHQVLSGLQADLINALEEVLMQIAAVTDLGDGEMVPAYQLVVELIEQAKAAALAEANQSGSGNIPLGDDGVAAAMVEDIATNAAPEMTDWSGQVTVSEDTSTLVVLTAAATDADGDTITYGLTGPDADKFFIDEASGEVTFLDQPDFEEKASFRFTVTADDGLESTARQVTVTITDANDAPRFGKFDSSPEIAENTVDAEVVTVTARDQDGDTLSYALTSGGDADAFTIDAATGVLRFNGSPDYETQKTYKIQVEVTDGIATETQEITVSVTDANDAPVMEQWQSNLTVDENIADPALVTAQASDEDGDTLSYALSGDDASAFTIDAATGAISFKDTPNYEEQASYSFTVTASDGNGGTVDQAVSVAITDVNDAPVFDDWESALSVAENTTNLFLVDATATDEDAGATLSYALSGADDAAFTIDSATGAISFKASPNYEAKDSYSVTVSVFDGANTVTRDITVTVEDVPEAPEITAISPTEVDENTIDFSFTVSAIDQDSTGLTFALEGDDKDAFSLGPTAIAENVGGYGGSAQVSVALNTPPDYEMQDQYALTIVVSDGVNETRENVTITVQDVDERPVWTVTPDEFVIVDENTTDLLVTTALAEDPEGQSIIYSLLGTNPDAFSINQSTGEISFKVSPDYETEQQYNLTVIATQADGQLARPSFVTIWVEDVNEAPELMLSAESVTLSEDLDGDTYVLNALASDVDRGDEVTLSLTGVDAKYFHIDQDSGDIEFSGKAPYPDYEAKSEYSFTVVATDKGGLSDSQDVTVSLTNVDPLVHLTVDTTLFATAGASYEAALSTVEGATAEFFASYPAWSMVLDDIFSTGLDDLSPTVSSSGITVTSNISGNSVAFNFVNFNPDSVESLITTIQNFSASGDFNDLTISGGFVSMEIKDSNGDLLASLSNTANGMEFFIEGVTTGQMDTLVLNGSFGNQIVDYIALWETIETVALDPSATDLDGALTLLSGLNDLIDMTGISMMAQGTTLATVSLDSTDTAQSLTYTLGDHVFTIAVDGLPGLIEGMIDAAGGAEAFIDAAMAGFYVESGEWNPGQQQIGDTTVNYTETYEELSIFYHFTSTYYEYGDGPSSGYYWIDEESNILGWSETWEGGIDPELSGEPSYIDGWGFDGFGNWLTEAEYVALHDILSNIQDYLGDLDDGINALALSIDYSIAGDSVLSLDVDKIADFFAAVQDSQVGPGDPSQLIAEYTADDGTTPVTELSNPGEDWAITLVGLEADDLSSFAGGFLDSQVLATS
ncbi:cadherin domain-containing protein [Rhodobacter aestuarii]|uniref:Cadherin domain-containing protein n=1 Tax=Rhodobacter aestuarii TaxID=453582 RepID=A0A1N7IX74_9RHOB|nr:cadherin domain-containing protein [Rhodobacter aestuarii]PTV97436.1 cadherin domain-containing protein [Rhodobacter aestuarii]SIS41698.1 Cadherin domain-containing protein [Rhodobacter aestuarii]